MGSITKVIKIAGISGSLRAASTNTGLLRAVAEASRSVEGVDFEILSIQDFPVFNEDLETPETYPDAVKTFKEKVAAADAIIFACPEYNFCISSPMKNAIDWASRQPNAFNDKPAAIIGSGGGNGAALAHYQLRQAGAFLNIHWINTKAVQVRRFINPPPFDASGDLIDDRTKGYLKTTVEDLRKFTLRLQLGLQALE